MYYILQTTLIQPFKNATYIIIRVKNMCVCNYVKNGSKGFKSILYFKFLRHENTILLCHIFEKFLLLGHFV